MLSEASSALAEGELLQREDAWNVDVAASATCIAATLRRRACSRPRAGSGRSRAAATAEGWASSAAGSGSRSSCSTTCSTSPGRPSAPASTAAPDLLDGTVTLPLILARERDPGLAALDLRAVRTPEQAEEVCDAIAATGVLEGREGEALEMVAAAKTELPELPEGQRAALELVADSVADRYA